MQDLKKDSESGRKKRIYQVAKELNISNEALIEFLQKNKFKARNHMALLTPDMLDLVYDQFKLAVPDTETESDFRRKIQEKRKEEEAHMKAVRQEIDEVLELSKTQVLEEAEEPVREKTGRGRSGRKAVRPEAKVGAEPAEEELKKAKARKKQGPEEPVRVAIKETPASGKKPVVKTDIAGEKTAPKKEEKPKRHLKRRPPGEAEETEGGPEVSDDKKWHKKDKFVKYGVAEDVEGAGVRRRRRKKKRKKAAVKIDEKEIEAQIKETFAKMGDTTRRKRYKKEKEVEEVEVDGRNILQTTEFTSVSELANLMNVPANEVIQSCMTLGQLVTINQRLDRDMITMVADEFGYEAEFLTEYGVERVEQQAEVEDAGKLASRPAVVTIMGHVDHGKTSLLD
ncbi:translation initiation factor IF-2 N-terminal domain-containing protein, partial [bacterium]|nr:translation initiation factor IF-2 N-terminal domain-containing protein [bacterium]